MWKAFCGARGSCTKSDKSLEEMSFGDEDYKFENEKEIRKK